VKKIKTKKNKPEIVIVSREREVIGNTWNIFPEARLSVNAREVENYKNEGICLDKKYILHDKLSCDEAKNATIDAYEDGSEIIMLDDDITKVGKFVPTGVNKNKPQKLTGEEFYKELCRGFNIARKNNYHMFGVAPTQNPLCFNNKNKIKTDVFINGPLTSLITTKLRLDLHIRLKSDYEFTAQHIHNKMGVFRLDYLWVDNDYDKLEGGRSCHKSPDDQKHSFNYIMNKWPQYFRENPKRPFEVILSNKRKKQ